MSCHWYDNSETAAFTPRDYQVELLAAAYERNIIICLGHKSSKEFIALKLLQEYGRRPQRLGNFNLYLTSHGAPSMTTMIQQLTDLTVFQPKDPHEIVDVLPPGYEVYMINPQSCLTILQKDRLQLQNVHLLILEDCHDENVHAVLLPIFEQYYESLASEKPKVLGLAGPLHNAGCPLEELSAMLKALEDNIDCKAETASDIVTVLRYCSKPIERIVQCAPFERDQLSQLLEEILCSRKAFLKNHRYDPFEIYNTDEFAEELKEIPDPKKEPLEILDTVLHALHEMGPWAASRVALNMHNRIEKQKIKTPHERHYILLCLVNTALFEVHTICDEVFSKLEDRKAVIKAYSSPKVLRLLEILSRFKPDDFATENKQIQRMDKELEQIDFQKLNRSLECSLQSMENIARQQFTSRSIIDNLDPIVKCNLDHFQLTNDPKRRPPPNTKRMANKYAMLRQMLPQNRGRRKPYCRRARDTNDALDTLCGIIFCNSNTTARVIFDLLVEVSRNDPTMKFVKSQFLSDRVADPVLEPKEAEFEHRRQEEVLKRFRIHDCNILVSTSVLEEGIDVPKCNLVIRWDTPNTYRSYVQCKGKARAAPAYHILLVAPTGTQASESCTDCQSEQLSDQAHRFLCHLRDIDIDESESSDEDADAASPFIIGSSKGIVKILNPEVITKQLPTASALTLHEIKDDVVPIVNANNKQLAITGEDTSTIRSTHELPIDESIKQNQMDNSLVNGQEQLSIVEIESTPNMDCEMITDAKNSSQKLTTANNYTDCYKVESLEAVLATLTSAQQKQHSPLSPSSSKNSLTKLVKELTINADEEQKVENEEKDDEGEEDSQPLEVPEQTLNTTAEENTNAIVEQVACNHVVEDTVENPIQTDVEADVNSSNDSLIVTPQQIASPQTMNGSFAAISNDHPSTKIGGSKQKKPSTRVKANYCIASEKSDDSIAHESIDGNGNGNGNGNVNVHNNGYANMEEQTSKIVEQLANYRQIEKILLDNCGNMEPPDEEHRHADKRNNYIEPYKPLADMLTAPAVDLSTSIALINKYCSKLPSDTFTKLTALWRCAATIRNDMTVFQYTIRLPINSPLKYDIVGVPMSTQVLARRMAALQACIKLHKSGELDDNLQPIGKEGFKAIEHDWESFELEEEDEKIVIDNIEPRPGTTKRRQYYYKRIASEFCDCRPTAQMPCYLYLLDLTLQCPIPEEQNTRGRKIYPPEEAQQGFGILTLKKIPKISAFPIFTRSGEVKVSIELAKDRIVLSEEQIQCINTFLNYTFTNVLRLQKFLMLFDPDSTENCVFIVPTVKKANKRRVIDWDFLKLIEKNANMMPTVVSEEERQATEFDANKFKDAVVMPWYRNQDQPQYFYVAEICPHLSPLSRFPGESYHTFKHYYSLKYGLQIQNSKQPLLDVDHTSARLNFLTPRYVNRKGVALPTSSEETKRAKRENLEQKQILVPELCTVHPFPASLWRTAVCLPCILYRINGLLLADDIRKKVCFDIGLGQSEVPENFNWPMLDFGWSLSEVLKKSRENKAKLDAATEANNCTPDDQKADNETPKLNCNEPKVEKSANEIVLEAEKKLQDKNFIEIGTWSNDMADDINYRPADEDEDEFLKCLPSNVSFCNQRITNGADNQWDLNEGDWGPSTFRSEHVNDKRAYFRRNSISYFGSDESLDSSSEDNNPEYSSNDEWDEESGALRIAFTSRNEAETIETEQEIEKHNKQLSIIRATNANEHDYQKTKNLQVGYNFASIKERMGELLNAFKADFGATTEQLKLQIHDSAMMVKHYEPFQLPKKLDLPHEIDLESIAQKQCKMWKFSKNVTNELIDQEGLKFRVEEIEQLNLEYVKAHPEEQFTIRSIGDVFDNFNDKNRMTFRKEDKQLLKHIKLDFEMGEHTSETPTVSNATKYVNCSRGREFSFDYQPDLIGHPGPSPSIILQALTMSNANDGINLERLETIGDSFLKYAITTYLYIKYENVHEGKLSHLRSKQVANLNLYRLGRKKLLGEYMIATKFEPHDNWLPPCYYVPKELEKALIEAKIPPHHWKLVDLPNIKKLSSSEICELVRRKADQLGLVNEDLVDNVGGGDGDGNGASISGSGCPPDENIDNNDFACFIPYNLVTQHSIPDKSVADCVEALIGAYLIECGSRGALLFMAWLGIRVLPFEQRLFDPAKLRIPGSTNPDNDNMITVYGDWTPPKSPLLRYLPNAEQELAVMLDGFAEFEANLGYKFRDRSYLLQAMTHASYSPNRLTDCYQRLEFLGDAVLDYLITRHLYEDPRQHSPGALTDLRSALVNNTIFASLAVRHGFHKYFRHLSPGLNEVIDRFVRIQNENGHVISEEYYLLSEEECDDAEDVEVPKALGDVFESIAGAIFLDSNMSLDVVWKVYSNMMKPEIEQFSNSVPKSPIRELLELEPETAKFGKPEKLADGRRVRVSVEVFSKGVFRGIGRNYRIAKCTAAKCALRQLKRQGLISKKD